MIDRKNILTDGVVDEAKVNGIVRRLVAKRAQIDPAQVTTEAHLTRDLGYESTEKASLYFDLEEEFGLESDDHTGLHSVETVSQAVSYVVGKLNG
ncbi:MAG: acyl carrier protein [Nanoarchaeota archaeon]|nr:acyl carrier protein [Nanoarchaeota archaeon]